MSLKESCEEHGCKVLTCGCDITVLESDKGFHEVLRAKDKWIVRLLDEIEELKNESTCNKNETEGRWL